MTITEHQRKCYLRFGTRAGECLLIYMRQPFQAIRLFLPGTVSETALSVADCACVNSGSALVVSEFVRNYFDGLRPAPPSLDWLLMAQLTENEQTLLRVVASIPYGQTMAYAEVAAAAGFDRGARFAGNTLGKNPFPIIIPCHRVIRSDGSLGGFGADTRLKEAMLRLEQM